MKSRVGKKVCTLCAELLSTVLSRSGRKVSQCEADM